MKCDFVILGAGVIGLAIAQTLSQRGLEVIVLEQESGIGQHASSRNSEVVHAGFYYPTGSLKAQTCVEGHDLLKSYAAKRKIPIAWPGKLVVAQTTRELSLLESLYAQGKRNGSKGLSIIGPAGLQELEPEIEGLAALWSRDTGIIDSHALLKSLHQDIEANGGIVILNSPVVAGTREPKGIQLEVGGLEPTHLLAKQIINATGAFAPLMVEKLGGRKHRSPGRLVKGNYMSYQGKSPFQRLIYPLPSRDGLGIHATLSLDGRLRFGPDTREVQEIDYAPDEDMTRMFAKSIASYWPGVKAELLNPDYAGIRSKLQTTTDAFSDFVIHDDRKEGYGTISLLGIESPGLTASLSLAKRVATMVESKI